MNYQTFRNLQVVMNNVKLLKLSGDSFWMNLIKINFLLYITEQYSSEMFLE